MENWLFSLIIFTGSFFAGTLGALSGLGGGIIVTPLLVFLLGVDIHAAMGSALIAVIATSLGSSASFIKTGYTNLRAAIFLATATTLGAMIGALLTKEAPQALLFIIFGLILTGSVIQTLVTAFSNKKSAAHSSALALSLKLNGQYPKNGQLVNYKVQSPLLGWLMMSFAGVLSGLLGIGSGAIKVLAMDQIMKFPFKVSTTTSNFMIGLTASASVGFYYKEGFIVPSLVMPVVIGVLLGSFLGSFLLPKLASSKLKILFSILVFIIATGMLYKGIKAWQA